MSSNLNTPSVAVFCPQSKAPQKDYLDELRSYICSHQHLKKLVQEVKELRSTWDDVARNNQGISELIQGPRYLQALSEWLTEGHSGPIANVMSGILSLPLLVIIQITQYFQFLELSGMSHSNCLSALGIGRGAGAQGYCAGLLPAFAVACAQDEADLVTITAKAIRIALAIGAYGELGDDEHVDGPTTIVMRLKRPGQGDEIIKGFTGAIRTLEAISELARGQGLLVQGMHLRGKVHNPENMGLAKELCDVCDRVENLQLPSSGQLHIQVNSNRNGKPLRNCNLTHEAVYTILASKCEWYAVLQDVAKCLRSPNTASLLHNFLLFGIGDPVPLAPFHQSHLNVTKTEIYRSIRQASISQYAFKDDSIAIIGAACRLPGANDLDELWDLISKGTSKCEEVRASRSTVQGSFRASQDPSNSKKTFFGNFIDDVEAFEHTFFKMNAKEAASMDPQQRILLELAYEAMDSSGSLRHHQRKSFDNVGCFVGASFTEYLENTSAHAATAYTATGTIRAFLCGKISYYFGWKGPSEVIDTACSSSLVAIHRACQAIKMGECPVALAGGINIITGIHNYIDLSKAGFLSTTGQCKPFDASADGYCRADGAGLVVLKRLRDALAEGNQVLSVITGVATNQGGLSPSITIPHSPSQIELYRRILTQSGMSPDYVTYVEAHGTGTQAGDPREIESIREVFGGSDRISDLHIGSLKGNIGHSETAAGVASLVKVLSMMKTRKIPPLACHKNLNSKIPPIAVDKMVLDKDISEWEAPIRVACVNSYGAAGSNAAIICCEGPSRADELHNSKPTDVPIFISAASKESLLAYCRKLEAYLDREVVDMRNLSFTLTERRQRHRFIWSKVACDVPELRAMLRNTSEKDITEHVSQPKSVVLAFGGQSKQVIGLDEQLYYSNPRLRQYIEKCDNEIVALGFPSILPHIFDQQPTANVVLLQTGTFAVQYSCARCWLDGGIKVDAVIGHSFGELTALVISGTLSLKDGIKIVASRASLIASKWGPERGTMIAVHCRRDVVAKLISTVGDDELEVACYNAETSQVVVGSSEAVTKAETLLNSSPEFKDVRYQRLDVSNGFHSKFTEPLLEELQAVANTVTLNLPEIPLEVCTREAPEISLGPQHFVQHTRKPVYFVDAVRRIEKRLGSCIWLEAGIDSPIISMVNRATADPQTHVFHGLSCTDKKGKSSNTLPSLLVNLWKESIEASFWPFLPPRENGPNQIWLPPYAFTKTRAWVENIDRVAEAQRNMSCGLISAGKPGTMVNPSLLVTPLNQSSEPNSFKVHISSNRFSRIVCGHAVRRRPLCPASMYMECATMALQNIQPTPDFSNRVRRFEDLRFEQPLGVDTNRDVCVTLKTTATPTTWKFVFSSSQKSGSPPTRATRHSHGIIKLEDPVRWEAYQRLVSNHLKELASKPGVETLMSTRAYGLFSQVVTYSDILRGISTIRMDGQQALAQIQVPEGYMGVDESTAVGLCDAVALDTFIQVVGLLINSSDNNTQGCCFIATGIENATLGNECNFLSTKSWTVYATYTMLKDQKAMGDVFILRQDHTIVGTILGVSFSNLSVDVLDNMLDGVNSPSLPKRSLRRVGHPCSPPRSISESSTRDSGYSSHTLASPSNGKNSEGSLRKLVAAYTGANADNILADTPLSDLGLDSLAAVELASDINADFGLDIPSADLIKMNLQGLSAALDVEVNSIPVTVTAVSQEVVKGIVSTSARDFDEQTRVRAIACELINEISGADFTEASETQTLREIGVDSLAVVQLRGDMESAFGLNLDDLHLDLKLGQVWELLGAQGSSLPENKLRLSEPTILGSAVTESANIPVHNDVGNRLQSTPKISLPACLGNPGGALYQSQLSLSSMADRCGYNNYWKTIARLEGEILVTYILEAYKELGIDLWKLPPGEELSTMMYLPRHEKLTRRFSHILQKHSIIELTERSSWVRTPKEWPQVSAQERVNKFISEFPGYQSEAELMAITGPKLAACLTGKADAVALLFSSRKSQAVLENFYFNSPMLATSTELLADVVKRTVSAASGRTVRIIEIGAGFGGTTKRLVEAVHHLDVDIEYTFTDIASTLVSRASRVFGQYEGTTMKFKTLNIEDKLPEEMRGSYDLVISTNCIHATRSKVDALCNIQKLLSADGFVILSEVVEIIDWYDIVYGLLEGWWLGIDETYPLQPLGTWLQYFTKAGLEATYSQGLTRDLNTQRLLIGSKRHGIISTDRPRSTNYSIETMVYKDIGGVKIHADVYLPRHPPPDPMAIALMIHGGGHITLSRKAIRVNQAEFLLDNGILPVSLDYRLCPEVKLREGPIADIRDAYIWSQNELPRAVVSAGIKLSTRIVVVGWSTGGHLAMTLGWGLKDADCDPPKAILSFYSPTDFESGEADVVFIVCTDLDVRRAEEYPERQMKMSQIIAALPKVPITNYSAQTGDMDSSDLGWVIPGDPRSELVLSLFKENNGLRLLLNGVADDGWKHQPHPNEIASISPVAQVRKGTYTIPTYMIHGTEDEIVPFHTAVNFVQALREYGIEGGLLAVPGARHIHDVGIKAGTDRWEAEVAPGYEFLFKKLADEDTLPTVPTEAV
ncbi:hypothetical protein E0Z10_g7743 [Xylaria hypoxylon]|uniref:Uncharacterized protein n=1 Tax=Xylaria hypoxylon TaxID=37992 RepID=A0A4Z0Y9Z7_9PEZI|nr:hypothetical protein E0Z10_g7743 [Xylaria hypoxylon]